MAGRRKEAPTVQRITFGRYITPHCDGYLLEHGRTKPRAAEFDKPMEEPVAVPNSKSAEKIALQVRDADTELSLNGIALDKGPYADKKGLVQRLMREIVADTNSTQEIIERTIDILRPLADPNAEAMFPRVYQSEDYHFMYLPDFGMMPDVQPTAGAILAQRERRIEDHTIGIEGIVVSHVMEPYLLAAAVLRRAGMNAYPALAVMPNEQTGESFSPAIAVIDLADEAPLRTFSLIRSHPAMGSLTILSDVAMTGVTHAITAEIRIRNLSLEMVRQFEDGRAMGLDEIQNQLDRVANALFECHKCWPGSYFIKDAIAFAAQGLAEAIATVSAQEIHANFPAAVRENPGLQGQLPQIIANSQQEALDAGTTFANHIAFSLGRCITSGNPMRTAEGNRKPAEE